MSMIGPKLQKTGNGGSSGHLSVKSLLAKPTFVDSNSDVRLRLGLKVLKKKWPTGRELTVLMKVRSKSVDVCGYSKVYSFRKRALYESTKRCNVNENNYQLFRKKPRLCCITKKSASSSSRTWWDQRQVFLGVLLLCSTLGFAIIISTLLSIAGMKRDFCNKTWNFSVGALEDKLRLEIHGQDVALRMLTSSVWEHLYGDSKKSSPLVLFLHGWSGSGKTFCAQIVADFCEKAGASIHWYFPMMNAGNDFGAWALQRMSNCTITVFVLDDFDVLDTFTIQQFVDVVTSWKLHPNQVLPIFIITSNKGAWFLRDQLLNVWSRNGSRKDMCYSDLVSNDSAMYWPFSSDFATFVPFLPLEKEHVVACIKRFLLSRSVQPSYNLVETIVNRTAFVGEGSAMLSKNGCKRLKVT